jgi:glycosyltransferase involved in cell wall biosynthesis
MNQTREEPVSNPLIRCVLYLEPRSLSLRYRCHGDWLGSKTVLQWWVERVLGMRGVGDVHLIVHTEAEMDELEQQMPADRVRVFRTRCYNERRALGELAAGVDDSVLAVLGLGAALAPDDLLERAAVHHREQGNNFTAVLGLPEGATPTLFGPDLLVALAESELPSLPPGAVAAVHRLIEVATTIGAELPFALQARPFDASEVFPVAEPELPRSVRIATPQDVGILRRVVAQLAPNAAPGSLAGLHLWKRERIRQSEREREQQRPRTISVNRRRRADGRTRILYVSNPSGFSGAEESLCQMMSHLDKHRFATTALVALDGKFADRLREAGATVIVRGCDFAGFTVGNLLYATDTLRQIRPDVVHLNADDGTTFAFAAKLMGLPVVLHVRNGAIAPYEDVAQNADAIITVSEFLRREILRFDIVPDRVRTIYDEVDCTSFRPGLWNRHKVRQELGIPGDAQVLLMIARYAPNKRHDLMLAAAARARAALPRLHLVLKGDIFSQADADLRVGLEEQARALGLMDAITWLRFVPDIRMVHQAADLLVLCSDREGLGRCVVEAMALELPVVVTDSGGSHELIGERERGYRAKGGDAEDLANQIVEALTCESRSRTLARAARRFAERELDSRLAAERVGQVYDAVAPRGVRVADGLGDRVTSVR